MISIKVKTINNNLLEYFYSNWSYKNKSENRIEKSSLFMKL